MGEIMVLKYGHWMLLGAFPDNVTSDIDFTDEAVVQCDVPVVKILLQVLVIYKRSQTEFWCEYLWGFYVLFLDPVLCIVLVS